MSLAYRWTRRRLMGERLFRRWLFHKVYADKSWGGDGISRFYSGEGSRGEVASVYIDRMAAVLQQYRAELGRPLQIVDLGCGDFAVGKALVAQVPDARYVGCDIVPALVAHNNASYGDDRVRFRHLDIVSDPLPEGDVCLARQVLQHLSNDEISRFLAAAKRYPRLYVTEGQPETRVGPVNPDKATGSAVRFDWATGRGGGVELDLPPFNLKTQEVFRVSIPSHEIIVTQRVFI